MVKLSGLVKRGHVWFARMIVPSDVRAVIGQAVFIRTTGERDPYRAATIAAPILAAFKKRILDARRGVKGELQEQAEALAIEYRRRRAIDPDEAELFKLEDAMTFAVERLAGRTLVEHHRLRSEIGGDAFNALLELPGGPNAARTYDVITARATPFLHNLDGWTKQAALRPRQRDQYIADLKQFAAEVPRSLETLTEDAVQTWIEGLMTSTDKPLTAKTVRRKLSALRNYWDYLDSHKIAPKTNPFANRRVKERRDLVELESSQRNRWTPQEVVKLWNAAADSGDKPLAYLIRMGAYTGARIEGLSKLKVNDIRTDPETKILFLHFAEKTRAGARDVPVHTTIKPLVEQLARDADAKGYLIHSNAANKYNERSAPLSKRFGHLRTKLGFAQNLDFHSIRKTVANLFENALCPEGVAADVVGHVKPTMTYGLYSGKTRMDVRMEWLEKAIRYPE